MPKHAGNIICPDCGSYLKEEENHIGVTRFGWGYFVGHQNAPDVPMQIATEAQTYCPFCADWLRMSYVKVPDPNQPGHAKQRKMLVDLDGPRTHIPMPSRKDWNTRVLFIIILWIPLVVFTIFFLSNN